MTTQPPDSPVWAAIARIDATTLHREHLREMQALLSAIWRAAPEGSDVRTLAQAAERLAMHDIELVEGMVSQAEAARAAAEQHARQEAQG
jgi:hypothetical protein